MTTLQLTIPAQKEDPAALKIRPREVRSWLDNLPFLDQQRSARLAREQLRLMNRQTIAPAARLEILGQFLGIYQRFIETRNSQSSADDELSSLIKRLCQDIGFGYKIVVNQLVNQRSGFMEQRQLPLALLGSIHTLGLQLLDCYNHYQLAPRALWGECLALYDYAWHNKHTGYSNSLPGFGKQQLDASFRTTALMRLADPYQLPAGIAVPLRTYLAEKDALTRVHEVPPENCNCFQLKQAFQDETPGQHLYLEVDDLLEQVGKDIGKLEKFGQSQSIGLPAEVPAQALLHGLKQTLEHWEHHPTRIAEREETHARIELVNGLHATYCMANRQRPFDPSMFLASGPGGNIDVTVNPASSEVPKQSLPESFSCTSLNRSSGGLAVRYRGARKALPKVGQLVALQRVGSSSDNRWVVAACRWLVEADDGSGFEMGLQYLTGDPRAVVIRLMDESGLGSDYQPAIAAIQKRGTTTVHTLISGNTELREGSLVALHENGRQQAVRCVEQLEDSPGYRRFLYEAVD